MSPKVIYVDRNDSTGRYLNSPKNGDAFYTFGWAGIMAREFKKENPDYLVECWKADSRISSVFTKEISDVLFRVYPGAHTPYLGILSTSLKKNLKIELKTSKDLIVNISSCNHMLFYRIALILKNHPLIIQHHGETTTEFDFKYRTGILRKLKALFLHSLERKAFCNVDVFFGLDIRIKDSLPSSFTGKFIQQTLGVDEKMFFPLDKEKSKKEIGLDPMMNYCLFVGRLDYTKRADMLIEAWNRVKDKFPKWRMIIAGNIPNMPLEDFARKSGILIYGKILQTELYKYLSAANVYILANYKGIHTFGGVGLLSIQSLFCETPVIGATVRNFPTDIQNDVGIYTETIDQLTQALESVLSQNKTFFSLREKAIPFYSWSAISRKTRQEYDNLLLKYKKNELH